MLNVLQEQRRKESTYKCDRRRSRVFSLEITSAHAMNVDNKLILNYPNDLFLHLYLILCEDYLKNRLNFLSESK